MGLIISGNPVSSGKKDKLQEKLVEIKTNGTHDIVPDSGHDGLSKVRVEVDVQGSSDDVDRTKPILFFDYDGRLLQSYTLEEAQALTELPELPTHPDLTGTGWTHTLEQVQSTPVLHVGAMYRTINGRTKFKYTLTPVTGLRPTINVSGSCTYAVYWPDGSVENYTGAQAISKTHAEYGEFEAEIEWISGVVVLGGGTYATTFFKHIEQYAQALTHIYVGDSFRVSNSAFAFASSLKEVMIPQSGALDDFTDAFTNSYTLKSVILPRGGYTIGASACIDGNNLKAVVISPRVTTIQDAAFYSCLTLSSIVIPQGVTGLGNNAFFGSFNLKDIVMLPKKPPTLGTAVFGQIRATAKIYVPDDSVAAYKAASGWSAYAKYIYPLSERQ